MQRVKFDPSLKPSPNLIAVPRVTGNFGGVVVITYPLPRFDQQKAEIEQRYKILSGAEGIDSNPVAQTAALTFGVPVVLVALTERYRHWFRVSHGVCEKTHEQLQDYCAHAILCDTSFAVSDASREPYFERDMKAAGIDHIGFYAGAPLRNPDGQRFGTLCLIDTEARDFTPQEITLLEHFAEMVSSDICLRSAGRYAVRDLIEVEEDKCSLYDLAMTDPLTGALNRRAMFHFAEREVKRAIRHDLDLAILMLDIDHFKQVNDVHGHAAGDEVLKQVGRLFRNSIRDEDLLARVGGEEFALILPETTAQDASILANRLRQSIKALKFVGDGGPFSITVSMGISEPLRGEDHVTEALERADKALYSAKHGGRDKVVIGETKLDHGKISACA